MFTPKNKGMDSAEVSRIQREAEEVNRMIEEKVGEIEQDPQELAKFMRERILPLLTTLNIEFTFLKARGNQAAIDSVANSEYTFHSLRNYLQYRGNNQQEQVERG